MLVYLVFPKSTVPHYDNNPPSLVAYSLMQRYINGGPYIVTEYAEPVFCKARTDSSFGAIDMTLMSRD